jgi:hypothetical protein
MQTSHLLENNFAYANAVAFIKAQEMLAEQKMQEKDEIAFCMKLSVNLATLQILYVCKVDDILNADPECFRSVAKLPHGLTTKDLCLILLASDHFSFNRYSVEWPNIEKQIFGNLWSLVEKALMGSTSAPLSTNSPFGTASAHHVDSKDDLARKLLKQCIGDRNKCGLAVVDMFYDEVAKRTLRKKMFKRETALLKTASDVLTGNETGNEDGGKSESSDFSLVQG